MPKRSQATDAALHAVAKQHEADDERRQRATAEKLFTVNELVNAWGVKSDVIRRFITSKDERPRLRAINMAKGSRNHWRVPQSAVDEFLMAKSQAKGEPSTMLNRQVRR